MRHVGLVAIVFSLIASSTALGDSTGCDALAQGAADGLSATVQADDATIHKPKSVTALTCLDGFFSGIGLDVITSGLDPVALIKSVAGKICQQATDAWNSTVGQNQCGLTLTGFNTGFNLGLGGGSFCPKLSFGGGAGNLASINGSGASTSGLLVNGQKQLPDGYSAFGEAN